MKEDKLKVINKIFNSEEIRTLWDEDEEKYYVSIVDVVGVLTESDNPRKYWSVLKVRLIGEGSELATNCSQLKLKSKDGKYRLTDVTDIEGMFRIIQSVPSKNAEPIKQWLASLGSERIDEIFDPSLGIQRLIDSYRSKGFSEEWIKSRVNALIARKSLTDVWEYCGVKDNEFAILTNTIYKSWSGMNAKEYKKFKGLTKENLRDNMSNIELILTDLGEEATKLIAINNKPSGLNENIEVAKKGGTIARNAKEEIENEIDSNLLN